MWDILKDPLLQRRLLFFHGILPGIFLTADFLGDRLGANPPEAIIRSTGVISIIFFVLTLAVTPLTRTFKWNWLARHRRWLGLLCFYYALVHLISYMVFDRGLVVSDIVLDIKKRPFILIGFFSFLLLLPLAMTSSNQMIRRLGAKKWKSLHRLTYVVAAAVPVHYWLIVKSDIYYPAIFALAMLVLLLYRVVMKFRRVSAPRIS